MKKILRRKSVLIPTIVFALAMVGTFIYVDVIARAAIEKGSTYALGVETSVDGVKLGVIDGSFGIDGFVVDNPEGFESNQLFTLRQGHLSVGVASLREETVEVPELVLEGIDINLEMDGNKSNYGVVLDHIRGFESRNKQESEKGSKKKFIVRELAIREVTAHVRVNLWNRETEMDVEIPEIRLENVGNENGGVELSQLSADVLKAVLGAVVESGGDLPGALRSNVLGQLRSLDTIDVEISSDLRQKGESLADEATSKLEEKTKQLGNLLD